MRPIRLKFLSSAVSRQMIACLLLVLVAVPAYAQSSVTLHDIARDPGTGLEYARTASPREAKFQEITQRPIYRVPTDIFDTPLKGWGAPGVALLDYDGDGDLDIYVTNGPGTPNSLFENFLAQEGTVRFVDVGETSGAALVAHESDGVCFGDLDNDGDPDLVVLGIEDSNRLLENVGGAFVDITDAAGDFGTAVRNSTSCSMGDVDGDGLLDIAVANTFADFSQQGAIFVEPFAQNQHNQLFHNQGGLSFVDVSETSGLLALGGIPEGAATITWGIAFADIDHDGDIDLVHADDQAAYPPAVLGGIDRGYLQVFVNDGTGHFENKTLEAGTDSPGQWMGLTYGDFDCNGALDIFGANLGDYMKTNLMDGYPLGASATRHFLGHGDGTFDDPGVGDLLTASVFSWGNSSLDVDNDGDLDVIYHGGLEVGPFVEATNPGVLLENTGTCTARFRWNQGAITEDHRLRTVQGVAVGDVDGDGFPDVVSVSSFDTRSEDMLTPYAVRYDSPFDGPVACFVPTFAPTDTPGELTWTGIEFDPGSLSVELNSGGNGNRSVTLELVGSVGLAEGGKSNRNAIGALVSVTPGAGPTFTRPVLGGSSYASQDALVQTYGVGTSYFTTVEVLWPGGTVNRLYGVRPGERLTLPEIPCSVDGEFPNRGEYLACVKGAVDELETAGVIDRAEGVRLTISALLARIRG
jgi:hypothetical protein